MGEHYGKEKSKKEGEGQTKEESQGQAKEESSKEEKSKVRSEDQSRKAVQEICIRFRQILLFTQEEALSRLRRALDFISF